MKRRQNVHGIILNLCAAPPFFMGHYVGHLKREARISNVYFLVLLSRRGEFFAYFCGWRERVNIFRKEIPMFVYTVGEEKAADRDLLDYLWRYVWSPFLPKSKRRRMFM